MLLFIVFSSVVLHGIRHSGNFEFFKVDTPSGGRKRKLNEMSQIPGFAIRKMRANAAAPLAAPRELNCALNIALVTRKPFGVGA